MATWKTVNGHGNYRNADAKQKAIRYILQAYKVKSGMYGGFFVNMTRPDESMMEVSRFFGKPNGVQLRHFVVSFEPGELSNLKTAGNIAWEMAQHLSNRYQCVYAVHEDRPNVHFHIIMNSVSYVDGSRYYGTRRDFHGFESQLRRILRKYGLHTLIYIPSVSPETEEAVG